MKCINEQHYIFKNFNIEDAIFTHPSYRRNVEFQRLEFLGDKILSYHIAKILFSNNNLSEGELSLSLSNLVNKKILSKIGSFLVENIKYNGTIQDSIIADTLEAWIGGIFIDGGNVSQIILNLWDPYFKNINFKKSSKNILQEYVQDMGLKIDYIYKSITDNNQNLFEATVHFKKFISIGTGHSKKEASEEAATKMLILIKLK